jgi:two-component system NtrC family response regulator
MAKRSALTPLSIYLAGETGTGKEVMAQLIHDWSDRRSGRFVPLNCAALSLSLVESELFGHVKGAFTGASHPRPGALLQAHNGTLFLDEVGDLPMDIQVKLLRFLENGEIRAVGSDHVSHAQVRVICATHKPLKALVEAGQFRRDLYYRLASVTLEILPLRERPEDISFLASEFASSMGKVLSPPALTRLQAYSWPGNVRELRHAVERACALSSTLTQILPETAFDFLLSPENTPGEPAFEEVTSTLNLHQMERILLLKALKRAKGNRSLAAKILGVARSTLFDMLKRHQIIGPRSTLSA